MNMQRFYSLLVARNLEFMRDRGTLLWNIIFPILIVVTLSFAFSEEESERFKVGVVTPHHSTTSEHPFLTLRYVRFLDVDDRSAAIEKVRRHQLDMVIDLQQRRYWVNDRSPNGYLLNQMMLLQQEDGVRPLSRETVTGEQIRYIDWVLPGVIGMNIMFGALFGIGYVIVKYRKNGVLKRLKATPVSALEFLSAQVVSRLLLLLLLASGIFIVLNAVFDFQMNGSYISLLAILLMGSLSLICLGLLVAARMSSQELANGVLNILTWPMMFLSGVWFSLEGAHPALQTLALALPLTHILDAARAVMIDGQALSQQLPQLGFLALFSVICLGLAAKAFRWE